MKKILVPTDFSVDSELALLIACSIARDTGSELIILHVIRPDECPEEEHDDDKLNRASSLYRSCWSQFLRLRPLVRGVPVAFQVMVGDPVESISKVAQRQCCDRIVIASHQKSYFQRQIYGSVSESLARRSLSPIVCINQSPFVQERFSMLDGLRQSLKSEPVLAAH